MLAELPAAHWFRRIVVAAVLLGVLLLTYMVLAPFVVPLIWAAILAYVTWLQRRYGETKAQQVVQPTCCTSRPA